MTFARTMSKARVAPIAGFLALTAVSAALAQTIDGIDLKADQGPDYRGHR
jgi:conjugal transfer pilus assembly protein TrbC